MNRLLAASPALLLTAAGSSLPILPGKWQSTVTITDMQMPNMPPGMGAAMRAHPTVVTACLTPAQAADGPARRSAGEQRQMPLYAVPGGGRAPSMRCCNAPSRRAR